MTGSNRPARMILSNTHTHKPHTHMLTKDQAKWVAFQLINPPKARHFLELLDEEHKLIGRCCLGNACHVFKMPRLILASKHRSGEYYHVRFEQSEQSLPPKLARKLNITRVGKFKTAHIADVMAYVKKGKLYDHHLTSLLEVNDFTDLDHYEIGMLISCAFRNGWFESYDYEQNS